MGLFDCVGENKNSGRYPVSPHHQAPLERGMSGRRSMGIFASNTSLKGNKHDITYWRHRLLCFLYKSESREDVTSLHIPLKQFGYNSIGDFIREIPAEIYEPYKSQLNPDIGLRKDFKVIWERDGIAEPGALKWEGSIEGQRCMGLQLDRKKAVPFGIHDGKGLFYCKPGHRALVPINEVFAYKEFLRQFVGQPPRKDSLALNLLPGRSSVRVAVAKQYKPGDRVHLPTEGKWATILWTGRIDGEWVVDLVYDPEKPRIASPDEPQMSRSLSMAEFIDEVGPENDTQQQKHGIRSQSQSSPTPPRHVPPPPPTTPPPKTPDLEDDVFIDLQDKVGKEKVGQKQTPTKLLESPYQRNIIITQNPHPIDNDRDTSEEEEDSQPSAEDDDDSGTDEEIEHSETDGGDHSASDKEDDPQHVPLVESSSDEASLHRTLSEPGPDLSKLEKLKLAQQRYQDFDPPPLKSKPTHKPMFNLASLGRKNKKPKPEVVKVPKTYKAQPVVISSSKDIHSPPPKKEFSFFSKSKKTLGHKPQPTEIVIEPQQIIKRLDSKNETDDETRPSFMRKDWNRSPITKKPEKGHRGLSSSSDHREVPVDVPANLRSPPASVTETPKTLIVDPVQDVAKPVRPQAIQKYSSDSYEDSSNDDDGQKNHVMNKDNLTHHEEKDAIPEMPKPLERAPSENESESDTTPPYSPAIKDVGFRMSPKTKKPRSNKGSSSSAFRSFGGIFSKSKPLPPKDYHFPQQNPEPEPPVRKESLEQKDTKNLPDTDSASHTSEDSNKQQVGRKLSGDSKGKNLFRRQAKQLPSNTVVEISGNPVPSPRATNAPEKVRHEMASNEQMGDQDFLTLDSLEVKQDEQSGWISPPPQSASTPGEGGTPKRKNSKGKTSLFGFSSTKKQKPTMGENTTNEPTIEDGEMVAIIDDSPRHQNQPEPKIKPRSSFRESFNRTFSFTKSKAGSMERRGSGGGSNRPSSLTYIDNNEAIGATNISRPKSKSASVLVDIQPWVERRGHRSDIHDMYDSPDESAPQSPSDPSPGSIPVALQPKQPDPSIPKHRIFTTPIGLFAFGQKLSSDSNQKPKKKTSFKGSKLPKPVKSSPPIQVVQSPPPVKPIVLPKPAPPCHPPPAVPASEEAPSPSARHLKSALKQRKEIDGIPKGVKIGDRVIWYNGRIPVPGYVKKLYKDGTDKYTAVVKFDRPMTEPALSLAREGDDYIITVEELLTPEILGIPLSPPATPLQTSQDSPPVTPLRHQDSSLDDIEEPVNDEVEECKSPSVRFVPSPSPEVSPARVPEINVQLASPVMSPSNDDDRVPPPFQEEEVEVACGVRRGIPSRDRTCCIETILFAMFYATNTFDTSLLYGSNSFEQDRDTRDIRMLLRTGIVVPLRQNGFCEWGAVKELKDLLQKTSPEFNSINNDAEILTLVLFDRALKLGKFISYDNHMTDYLHQMVLNPRDLCKSGTLQQLFESSLEIMDNAKLKTPPSPALILEIPRANDKLVHYDAVIPNLSISLSHLLENGPRLCICGMVAKYECLKCTEKSGEKALVYCDNCTAMADQIHFQLGHSSSLVQIAQASFSMDLVAVICVKAGHYTAFVKCGNQRASPWLFYDAAEIDNPKVSLEQNLGMWIDRLEKYPGKYHEAFVHPLLTHFLSNLHICVYKPREKSSLV